MLTGQASALILGRRAQVGATSILNGQQATIDDSLSARNLEMNVFLGRMASTAQELAHYHSGTEDGSIPFLLGLPCISAGRCISCKGVKPVVYQASRYSTFGILSFYLVVSLVSLIICLTLIHHGIIISYKVTVRLVSFCIVHDMQSYFQMLNIKVAMHMQYPVNELGLGWPACTLPANLEKFPLPGQIPDLFLILGSG